MIDMLAVVTSVERLDERTPEFESLGYEVMGEFGMPGRRYFRKNSPVGERTHQIHAFQAGSADVDRHLAFRDYLRADHKFARQYATLKSRLAEQYPSDMAAYTEGKNGFIRNVEARAATWRGQIR